MVDFLETLRTQVLVADGAMATELVRRICLEQSRPTGAAPPQAWTAVDSLTLTRPDLVRAVHDDYCAAGANIIGTNTFQATATAQDRGISATAIRGLNQAAAALACEVRDTWRARHPAVPRFVSGILGPGPARTADAVATRLDYFEQASGLLDGGCDLLAVETARDAAHTAAVLAGVLDALAAVGRSVPVAVSFAPDGQGDTVSGRPIADVLRALPLQACSLVGLNCGVPALLGETGLEQLLHCHGTVSYAPSAGLPDTNGDYAIDPQRFATLVWTAAGGRARVVGGCCGTSPAHVAHLAAAVAGR